MKRKSQVCGEYPRSVYKFFDKEEYAVDFVEKGRFRVKLLQGYKEIECRNRRDVTEGQAHYKTKGPNPAIAILPNFDFIECQTNKDMDHQGSYSRPVFIFSCCHLDVNLEEMKKRFGSFVVKIHIPVALAIDIDYTLNHEDGSGHFLVEGRSVEYNKGQRIEDDRQDIELADLAYTQKPEKNPDIPYQLYSDEKEFRLCITSLDHKRDAELLKKDFLVIDMGGKIKYAQLL